MLFDTDVLIWVFRGNAKAAKRVDSEAERSVSVVTYMELLQGARDRQEVKAIRSFLTDFGFQMVPLSENIGHRASIYIEEYALKAGMCMGDALVGATAVENGLRLCTANRKHYVAISDLDLKIFRP
ncbi:MAG: type II toxin-antitoxin system VapC family toxin [Planctomycetes bacterium]|nr:type II toxin-antitoxin system VapC family toxin [Planctomycetota bacterium]